MECKLSVENTQLLKDVEYWKKSAMEERKMQDKVRDDERKWYDKYEEMMSKLMGNRPGEIGYANFEDCMNQFLIRYSLATSQESPTFEFKERQTDSYYSYKTFPESYVLPKETRIPLFTKNKNLSE